MSPDDEYQIPIDPMDELQCESCQRAPVRRTLPDC